ncbi:HNH endonuclease [Verrucomicrobiota bacterium]
MDFCWFTSYIGYPNFFKKSGNSHELARFFVKFAKAALEGASYPDAKELFPELDHAQVETKKAAFQEYGLLFVVPRSNRIVLTPAGLQLYHYCKKPSEIEKNRRQIALTLTRALARYQFNNPLPVGGNRGRPRAEMTDVLPYLLCYFLLMKLGGVLTVSELRGVIFGIRKTKDLHKAGAAIAARRKTGKPFPALPSLPSNRGTANNLKIYFMSHLTLDGELMDVANVFAFYGKEQTWELSKFGAEIIEIVLDHEWPSWRSASPAIPGAKGYASIPDYFNNGVGQYFGDDLVGEAIGEITKRDLKTFGGVVDVHDIESLKKLSVKEFVDGRKKLVSHVRLETVRNPSLVKQAKRAFKTKHGKLFCEVCGFDFEKKYGKRGRDYIEGHHKAPLSEMETRTKLTIADIGMVCSNCHRMLHRPPWISMEKLAALLVRKRKKV